jgi:hypothetical protein
MFTLHVLYCRFHLYALQISFNYIVFICSSIRMLYNISLLIEPYVDVSTKSKNKEAKYLKINTLMCRT